MIKKWGGTAACLIAVLTIVSGCTNGGQGGTKQAPDKETATVQPSKPVTITLFNAQPGAFDFEKLGFVQAIQTKYPHITVKIINKQKGTDYPELILSKTPIDIIYESTAFTVSNIKKYGFHTDLQEYVEKNGFKLDAFDPNVLGHSMSTNSEGKLYGLPFSMNRYALYYNKNLFDKFAVSYPKDGMTWDEVYELAKKMTRVEGGVTYNGFTASPGKMLLNNQLSLTPLDPKEDKATVNTDSWKLLFENIKRFGEIPNNAFVPEPDSLKGTVAMILDSGSISQATDIDWDLVSVPTLKEKPKTGFKPASLSLFLAQTSENKDEAFKVISYLVSEEMQTMLTKQAIGTPLLSPEVRKSFGQNLPQWKGKNVNSLYYYPDAPAAPPRAEGLVDVSVDFSKPFKMQGDANTILRQFNEEIDKAIQTAK